MRIIQSWEPSGAKIEPVEHLTEPIGLFASTPRMKISRDGERLCFEIRNRGEEWAVSLTPAETEALISFLKIKG